MTRIEVEAVKQVMHRARELGTFTKQDLFEYLSDTKLSQESKEKVVLYLLTSNAVEDVGANTYAVHTT